MEHTWPGNVRELQNTIERAVILSSDQKLIHPNTLNLSQHIQEETEAPTEENLLINLETLEKRHILHVLKVMKGNRTKAASLLAISTRTLSNKLKQYAISE